MTRLIVTVALAFLGVALVCFAPAGLRAEDLDLNETEHYVLHTEGASPEEVAEWARVIEAAWEPYGAFFGGTPDLDDGAKLRVQVFAERSGWEAALRSAGSPVPQKAGGMYWPPTRTAYLYRQPTRHFTRVLLLHECAHQYHYAAATDNKAPVGAWYIEGIAEYLSWHLWDGERVTPGVVPVVSLKDYPALALEELRREDYPWKDMLADKRPASRPVAWALVSYLARPGDAGAAKKFAALTRRMNRTSPPAAALRKAYGRKGPTREAQVAWLETAQQPFVQVFNEWEGTSEQGLRGTAGVVSFSRLKEDARSLTASLRVPAAGAKLRGGLLLHFIGPDDYTVGLVLRSGQVRVDRRKSGKWTNLATGQVKLGDAATVPLRATREGEQVTFEVAGTKVGAWPLPGATFGVVVDGCTLHFDELVWE